MKLNSRIPLIILVLIIGFSACKKDNYMDWKIINQQWLDNLKEANKTDSTFHVTSSGLCYKVIYEGWKYNSKPNINSIVRVNYKGSLIDGSVFDSVATGKTIDLSLSSSIAGWKEALPKMYDGANYILYIPYKLGYDTTSTNTEIPPYSTLIFNITLNHTFN